MARKQNLLEDLDWSKMHRDNSARELQEELEILKESQEVLEVSEEGEERSQVVVIENVEMMLVLPPAINIQASELQHYTKGTCLQSRGIIFFLCSSCKP